MREARRDAGRMSSIPHSSASHQSSTVMEEVTSRIEVERLISMQLTRSTRSLQFPSAKASSVTITVFLHAELSKSAASLMLCADCTTSRFDILRDGRFRAPVGHENYCSCSLV